MTRFKLFLEDFLSMGKLSADELSKGQRLDKDETDNFVKVDGKSFYKIISRIRTNDIAKGDKAKGLETLSLYSASDYMKMQCFVGVNNSSGYCLKDKHELISVFSVAGSSGSAIVQDAIKRGARHLDCFAIRNNSHISGDLYTLYSRNGFKVDKSMNSGTPGESYAIVNGISDFVDDNENVHPEDPRVVIFMKL